LPERVPRSRGTDQYGPRSRLAYTPDDSALSSDREMEDNGPDRTGLPVTPRLAFADQIPRRGGQPRSRGHATDNRTQQRRRKGQDSGADRQRSKW